MQYSIITEESAKDSTYIKSISDAVAEIIERVNSTGLPEHFVEIHIAKDAENVIPETGSGGWTEFPNKIWVYFDDGNPNFCKSPKEKMRSATAHELGHAFRELRVPFPGTLLDDLVAEGIADHLDLKLVGGEGKPWSNFLERNEIAALFEKAKPILKERDHDYFGWFMGSQKLDLPKWGGYSLGFDIVYRYLQKTNLGVIDVIHFESEKFIKDYIPELNQDRNKDGFIL